MTAAIPPVIRVDAAGYGHVLAAWRGQTQIFQATRVARPPAPLPPALARCFTDGVYALVELDRSQRVYRFFETQGLRAPYGRDHPSFVRMLVQQRHPSRPDGLWWTPRRPALEIDNLAVASLHRGDERRALAVSREWGRFDYCVEALIAPGMQVYVGRTAPQQESAMYGGQHYAGGAIQFRLQSPLHVVVVRTYPIR